MIVLDKKGESKAINLDKRSDIESVAATLKWTTAVDLDLHAFVGTKKGKFEHYYFGNKGSLKKSPYIELDGDEGVGNTAGDNQEQIKVATLDHVEYIFFACNIFRFFGFLNSGDNFSKYDGQVIVVTNAGDNIRVPMTSTTPGKWCLIAGIVNKNGAPVVVNVNTVMTTEPSERDLLALAN